MAYIVPEPNAAVAGTCARMDRRLRLAAWPSIVAAGAAIALFASTLSALALTNCETILNSGNTSQVVIASRIELERVTGRDIFGAYANTGIRVSSNSAVHHQVSWQRSIHRRISRLWRMRITRTSNPASLQVKHWFSGTRGSTTQSLELSQDSDRKIPVSIRPLPPVVACYNDTHQVVEGGVDIFVDLNRLPAAGRYIAALETTVDLP